MAPKKRRTVCATESVGILALPAEVLATFAGNCGIFGASYKVGEPIYWCRETDKTRAMRCHEHCYLARTRGYGPSSKPSPAEGELRRHRRN
jgi:hypothetical protein